MIRYLIKNNLKLMIRNKWLIVSIILGPIFVIAILSSAFEELMKSYEKADAFQVGYRLEETEAFTAYIEQIKKAGEEAGIVFTEYPEGEPEKLISGNDLAGFVAFGKEEYIVYKSADYKTEGITLEYFISRIFCKTTEGMLQSPAVSAQDMELPVKELDYMPAISSKDYYGIIYIVYFIWCAIVCVSGILSSEKKNGISKKFQVTPVSELGLFLAKGIPCVLVLTGGMSAVAFLCAWMFGITWGNIPWSILILFLAILAATAFGLLVFYVFDNLAVTIIVVFTVVWCMGFVGGSFETYMFSSIPEWIKKLSPIYYIDRTLVEYSCMGKSSYTKPCILYLLVLIAVCTAGALLADRIRKRGRA